MDERDRIEKLERRIADLEKQIETLKQEPETEAASYQRMKLKTLEVEQIQIVEEDGTIRMSIHNKERMPTFPERKGGSSAGMLFFAEDGVENGGLVIGNTVGLKFDQHHSTDVVGLVNGGGIKGLQVWDRPPGPLKEFNEQFQREHGRKPYVKEVEFDRAFIGRWINGEAKVSLCDSRGIERLRMLVDSDDVPRIEMLNENGEVIHCLAAESYKPLKLPPIDSLPKDQTGRTPAHWLGVFDYNIDKVLDHFVQNRTREFLGEEVYTKWHEWLIKVKQMNSTEGEY